MSFQIKHFNGIFSFRLSSNFISKDFIQFSNEIFFYSIHNKIIQQNSKEICLIQFKII